MYCKKNWSNYVHNCDDRFCDYYKNLQCPTVLPKDCTTITLYDELMDIIGQDKYHVPVGSVLQFANKYREHLEGIEK
jgi:hypothetical protein